MYPPICRCFYFVLCATPSVMISFILVPRGAGLPMLGLGCATNLCRDLFLQPCFVSAERLRNALLCALGTAPCGFFNTWMHSAACRRSAFVRAEKAWSIGPPACHAINKQTSPLSTAAFLCLRVAAPKFHVHPPGVPKGSPTGYIRPSYRKTIHLRRGSAMRHICFTTERTLLYGAFCVLLSCCRSRPSSRNGKQIGKRPPPPPHSATTSKSLPPPPFDNSMAHSFSAPVVEHAPWPIFHALLYLTAFVCPLQPPSCSFCYVSHSLCTYVPSVLICSLLCMSLLTQREMSVLHRRQVCTERLLHIGHSFVFNLPLEARKCVLGLDRRVSDPDI